jgi:predicted tellurium resistance membrane protein TerC
MTAELVQLLGSAEAWASLLTLTALEIVLGIDNVIFLSIVTAKLPVAQQARARLIGLGLAAAMRVGLLLSISWIIGLTEAIFAFGDHVVSWRDLVLLVGGLFLLIKGTMEIHHMTEGGGADQAPARSTTFAAAIVQIVLLDIVFSLDSVITAVGMARHIEVMIAAVLISVGVMLLAAKPIGAFIQRHPTMKMLALSFLLLVGVALIADGLHFHIPRGYLYFAIAFSLGVEVLNLLAGRGRAKRRAESPPAATPPQLTP